MIGFLKSMLLSDDKRLRSINRHMKTEMLEEHETYSGFLEKLNFLALAHENIADFKPYLRN